MPRVRAAAGPNVQVLGHQPFEVLKQHMQNAKAFVFAAEEDFGITPVEAQACGTPVIAFGRGGALETVVSRDEHADGTGIFFMNQTADSLMGAVRRFESIAGSICPNHCRAQALRFSQEAFNEGIAQVVSRATEVLSY
jgi:glycosyltransferase involved in cell wall biosynthesis